MQAIIGDGNIQVQGDINIVTFNETKILQISIEEIKTRKIIVTSPYKGLKKFEPADKDLFFGRDQFLKGLLNELEQTNLILLLGASGSGKSSVVRAGLIPWLSQKFGSRLVNLMFTPDTDPFESFYASLLGKYKQAEAQIAREAKADTLTQVVTRLKQPDDYWFIFIDQFEELFTTSQSEKRDQFITNLAKLSKTKERSIKIMVTMRADFLDKLSPYPRLVKATDKHRPLIAEMQPDELRLAIEQPAAHHGVVFETGLVEEIIKDVQGQAGYLPLLQYTLNLLWEIEVETNSINDRTLSISTYRQIGGVRGALQKHIDYIYDSLPEVEKFATQRIFLKLVDIGKDTEFGTEWKPVRRRALKSEFNDELEQSVLAKLINENLLVSDQEPQSQESTVDITHEILLTSWTTLNTWIKQNRQAIALRNRLNDDVALWKFQKADDELWNGSKLEQILELRKDATFNQVLGGFNDAANQFIDASVGLRDRQRRKTIIGLTSFSVVALILAGAAGLGWLSTEFQRQQTITGLTTASEELFDSNKEFDALLASLNAGKQVKQAAFGVNSDMQFQLKVALQQAIYGVKERNRLEKHKARVISVSYSPNGKTLASASADKTIKLWDVATGKEISTLTGHNDVVTVVSFSPDGKTLASASVGDKTVRLWDITTGKEIFTFSGYQADDQGNNGVSFSPDGQLLAFACKGNTIQLWNVATRQKIATLIGHKDRVDGVSFSPKGRLLASASLDGTVKLWDITTYKEIPSNMQHYPWVCGVSFSPDGQLLASGGDGGSVILWNVATRTKFADLPNFTGNERVTNLSFSPNGQLLAASGFNYDINLWNVDTLKKIPSLTGHSAMVHNIRFSPDGQWLASASSDRSIKLWYIAQRLEVKSLSSYDDYVFSVSFSPNGRRLASSDKESSVKLWDVATGQQSKTFMGHQHWVSSVSFSPDEKYLASGSWDGTVKLWDVATGQPIKTFFEHKHWVNSVSFSPDGKYLASDSWDRTVKLRDVATGKEIRTLTGHKDTITAVSFSRDGRLLASASRDQTIKLWDVATRTIIATLTGHRGEVNTTSFSPDGRLLASAGETTTIKLWNVATGKELATLTGHKAGVNSVSFSPDGRVLASASNDNTIILWDVATHKKINIFNAKAEVKSISFSPDGRLLASGSRSGTVILWDLKALSNLTLDNLLARGCDWVRGYLQTNPNVSDSDKQLCNGIGTANRKGDG